MKEYFMHVKGPEILNMWWGESERIVREIFSTARKNAGRFPAFSLYRRSGKHPRHAPCLSLFEHSLHLVPMFCSEMDGLDSLHDVVIILASNRADLIDPRFFVQAGSTGRSR